MIFIMTSRMGKPTVLFTYMMILFTYLFKILFLIHH